MKKQALWLLGVGGVFTSFAFLTGNIFNIPDSIEDFFKGFGVALIIGALVIQKKAQKPRLVSAKSGV